MIQKTSIRWVHLDDGTFCQFGHGYCHPHGCDGIVSECVYAILKDKTEIERAHWWKKQEGSESVGQRHNAPMPARARRRHVESPVPLPVVARRSIVRPINVIVAAAMAIAEKRMTKPEKVTSQDSDWQAEVWKFYNTIGELHFGLQWKAAAISRVKIVLAKRPVGGGDPEVVEIDPTSPMADRTAAGIVSSFAGGSEGQSDLLRAAAIPTSGVGECYVVIDALDGETDVYTPNDVKVQQGTWTCGEIELAPEDLVIHVKKRHPSDAKRVDSAVRAVLPVLRELWILNQQLLGASQSRLAGAGLLIVPQSISAPPLAPTPDDESDMPDDALSEAEQDPFLVALIEAMITPIHDPESAAAVVPLIVRVPDDATGKVQHLRFDVPFDPEMRALRDEAIRRLALGLDAPSSALLGNEDSSHWTAWADDEISVKLWVIPEAKVILKPLTKEWLWPALEQAGLSPEAAREYMLWPDASELEQRPDKSSNVLQAYDRAEASGEALRREIGLEETDRPDEIELQRIIDLKKSLAGLPTSAVAEPGVAITRGLPDTQGERPGE